MDKAIEKYVFALIELRDRIDYYDYQVRSFQPYFKESKGNSNARLYILQQTLKELQELRSSILDIKI